MHKRSNCAMLQICIKAQRIQYNLYFENNINTNQPKINTKLALNHCSTAITYSEQKRYTLC